MTAFAANLSFLLFDIGWLTSHPVLFLVGLLPGMVLQPLCLIEAVKQKEDRFVIAMQMSMLIWVFGNVLWAGSQQIWPEPCGFLADIPFFEHLDPKYYVLLLVTSTYIMAVTVLVMMLPYAMCLSLQFSFTTRQASEEIATRPRPQEEIESSVQSLSLRYALSRMTSGNISETRSREIPLASQQWYRLLYMLPYLITNWLWNFANWLQARTDGASFVSLVALSILMGVFGAVSVLLGSQIIWYEYKGINYSNAMLLTSDVVWVFGNVVWAVQNTLEDFSSDRLNEMLLQLSLAIFIIAGACMFATLCVVNKSGPIRASRIGSFLVQSGTLCLQEEDIASARVVLNSTPTLS